MNKYTLAIETSCDDTSISILEGIEVISLKTFSQIKEHKKFGGVIPELASRLHSKHIFCLIDSAVKDAKISIDKIDRIAVTGGPGLVNTLQIGIVVAKTISMALNIPLYDINHLEAHAYSPFIGVEPKRIPKNAIVLLVSGGHTELLLKKGWKFDLIGKTLDDSIGEAFDKVSKSLKLGYPGGKIIDDIASNSNEEPISCPISNLEGYDFSYSGLKSSVFQKSKIKNINTESLVKGFQNAAISQIINKVKKAVSDFKINDVIIGGGVSANSLLRSELNNIDNLNVFLPKLLYTCDNAAMIGYLASIKIDANKINPSKLNFDAEPRRKI